MTAEQSRPAVNGAAKSSSTRQGERLNPTVTEPISFPWGQGLQRRRHGARRLAALRDGVHDPLTRLARPLDRGTFGLSTAELAAEKSRLSVDGWRDWELTERFDAEATS